MAKKNFIFGTMVITLTLAVFTSCRSVPDVSYSGLTLATTGQNSRILNLENYGDSGTPYYLQGENLIKKGFVDTTGEKYGYYYIHFDESSSENNSSWQNIAVYTLFIPVLLGMPISDTDFTVTVYLDVFNSNGDLVKTYYKKSDRFTLYAGWYYGYNPQKNVAKRASKLFDAIQKDILADSAEINRQLKDAGPITSEKDGAARDLISQNIAPKLRRNSYVDDFNGSVRNWTVYTDSSGKVLRSGTEKIYTSDTEKKYTASGSSGSSSVASSASAAPSTPAFNGGVYKASVGGQSQKLHFFDAMKQVTYKIDGSNIAQGSYSVSGSSVIVKYTFFYGDEVTRKNLEGQTIVCTIINDTTLSTTGGITYTR